MMTDCIFCKIIKGEIRAYKIYEDEYCIAFLDINPLNPGHSLVVPKLHVENILDADDETVSAVFRAVKRVSRLLLDKLKASGVNVLHNAGREANQEVMHFHVHVIPRYDPHDLKLTDWWRSNVKKLDLEEIYRRIVS
ncbi:MAG: HIT family protein [Crenarchaeota archaeon]|nr:HIT family protein [Thermoproteota archaeon]